MAGTILTPGQEDIKRPHTATKPTNFLEKEMYLSEFQGDEKSVVRENLEVYPKDSVYNKQESQTLIDKAIEKAFSQYLALKDPHGIIPIVKEMLVGYIKENGSVPFTQPQSGVDPTKDSHLVTKRFITNLLKDHINVEDPHKILPQVKTLLKQYAIQTDTYSKSQVYTKLEVDQKDSQYVKKDGSIPFTNTQIGVDPIQDNHLATKRFVDSSIYKHRTELDPHGFSTILSNKLSAYAKSSDVYDKSKTYSKAQLDTIINSLVSEVAKELIKEHIKAKDPHHILDEVNSQNYVKNDGSVPFINPQKGKDAVDEYDLVTLHQVSKEVEQLQKQIDDSQPIWITSGPVQSTVGHLDDNTPVPATMTLQEVLDAIFYGSGISITAPDKAEYSNSVPVTLCIHGSTALIDYAELYQDGELLYTFTGENFKDGCVTVDSSIITEDSELTFRVVYTNSSEHEETITVQVAFPVFIGLLPKWQRGTTLTWSDLKELSNESQNNQFIWESDNISQVSIQYEFKDTKLRHPFIVVPEDYPPLENITTASQKFGIEAFDVVTQSLMVPGTEPIGKLYKFYIYKQALSSLNQKVTFNFAKK